MNQIPELKISEAEYNLPDNGGIGKMAVLMYSGTGDPKKILDFAVHQYADKGYYELIDAHLDNPWMRVLLSDINNLKQRNFDANSDKLSNRYKE